MIIEIKVIRTLFVAAALALLSSCQYDLETLFLYDPGSDSVPPTVIETLPVRGAHLETISTASITYSEEVIGAENLSSYSLSGSGSTGLNIDSIDVLGANTYRLNISGTVIDGAINIDVAGVSDLAGNAMSPDPISYLGWWDTDWSHRAKLSFDKSAPSVALTDFTILAKLNSSRIDYSVTQFDGRDLRFRDRDLSVLNNSILNFETEKWDGAGNSAIWVRVPDIPAGSLADYIWMYYGNSTAPNTQTPVFIENTWDNDFKAVWHFNSITDATANDFDLLDSTVNNQNAVSENIGPVISSDIGNAYRFDNIGTEALAVGDWVDLGISDTFFMDPFDHKTIEIRFKADRITGTQTLLEEGGSGQGILVGLDDIPGIPGDSLVMPPNVPSILTATRNGGDLADNYEPFSDTSNYHNVASVFDGNPNQRFYLYLDGNGDFIDPLYPTVGNHTGNPGIGVSPDSDAYESSLNWFQGIIDEVRISDVARSAGWIAAQNLSMSDGFITYTEE